MFGMAMNREQALEWMERWKAVDEISLRELRETTMEEKFSHLASLMTSISLFPWSGESHEEDERVRELWARLRERTGR